MKHPLLDIGAYVRYDDENGSVGMITYIRNDGPFVQDPVLYVQWCYGTNIFGELMVANTCVRLDQITKISKKDYLKIANRQHEKYTLEQIQNDKL